MNALHERFPSVKREGVVTRPHLWASSAGYEFLAVFGDADVGQTAPSATNDGLTAYGWLLTHATFGSATSADFLSSSDRNAPGAQSSASGQLLSSPRIFGSYDHALQASRFLGYLPTQLTAEFSVSWTVASTNETIAFIGLGAPGQTDATAAGSVGAVTSNSANFVLVSDTQTDAGAAVGTGHRIFKIVVAAATTEWFIDDVSQGTITTEADIWPTSVVMAAGTNVPRLSQVRVYYS